MMDDYLSETEEWLLKQSINVEDLIKILQNYPPDMKIMTTWESTFHSLQKKNIYESKTGSFLYLDADENFYKKELSKNPKENELKE